MNRSSHLRRVGFLLCLFCSACQGSSKDSGATGTETNWLKVCSSDDECGDLSCECGVCTLDCQRTSDCADFDGTCRSGNDGVVLALCGGPRPEETGLCLEATPVGEDDSEPDAGTTDAPTFSTASSTAVSAEPDASRIDETDEADETNQTLDDSGEPSDSVDRDAAGSDTETAPNSDSDPDSTESDASSVDSGTENETTATSPDNACDDLDRGSLNGCCYEDTDCAAGERCHDADCTLPAAGRCAAPSAGTCFGDIDCAEGERCEGGSLAPCGTLGPDQIGSCVADCEYDSCHPERCDEPNEPCCDPFPGDGVNYCNSGLVCRGNACEYDAMTTTPEELERQSCEDTGGTWDYEACDHYLCGAPRECEAIDPGCDCGDGRNFGALGCAPARECEDLAPTFQCGDQTCGTITSQYCEEFTGGPGIVTYTCRDVPTECELVTCSCVVPVVDPPYSCASGESGELIVIPPPAP